MKYNKSINIAKGVVLTKDMVTDVDFFVGIRKYGKSYSVGVIEEEFQKANWPFIIIDPMGIHYGLRQHYNNVVIVGGEHADLEITDDNIYNVINQGINVVFDLNECDIDYQRIVCCNILGVVKELNRGALKIIIEESDIFVPQRGGDKECKNLIIWLVRKGRQDGIGMSLISQRFTSIDKEALTQVDNYVVFRMNSPADLPTLKKFIDKDNVNKIKTLDVGECYISSKYYTGITKIKPRTTEHQGFTPVLGEKRKKIRLRKLNKRIVLKLERSDDGVIKKFFAKFF